MVSTKPGQGEILAMLGHGREEPTDPMRAKPASHFVATAVLRL